LPRTAICPKCSSDAVKRSHRQTLKERVASFLMLYPYRCRKCDTRFLRLRTPGGTSRGGSDNRIEPWKKSRREILLYGVGVLFFLALLSLIVRERNSPSDGN
jgi:hypothetical protein